MPIPTTDLSDPSFPHGTPNGNRYGCLTDDQCPKTPSCREARRRRAKRNAVLRARGQRADRSIPAAVMLAHVDQLRAAIPGLTYTAIAARAGVSATSLIHSRRAGTTSRDTQDAILGVTVDALQAEQAWANVPSEGVGRMLESLAAAGFPVRWIQQQTGLTDLYRFMSHDQRHLAGTTGVCNRRTREAITDLYEQIGGRLADPARDGLTRRQISVAKAYARRHGYHPPAAYDDDGNLDPRALPDHPHAQADTQAARLLDMAYALATVGATQGQAAARRAVAETGPAGQKTCERVVTRLGLVFRPRGSKLDLTPTERQKVNAATFARIREVYDAYTGGEVGPVEAVLELDLTSVGRGLGIPFDHPEVEPFARRRPDSRAGRAWHEWQARHTKTRSSRQASEAAGEAA